MPPRRILEGDSHFEEDGVAVGCDDGGIQHVLDRRSHLPVEVQARHQGGVGNPERDADGPVGAVRGRL